MGLWSPLCWISEHEWVVFRETNKVIILKCEFCGKFKKIYKD